MPTSRLRKALALAGIASMVVALAACAPGAAGSTEAESKTLKIGQLVSYNVLDISKDLDLSTALPSGAPVQWSTGFDAFQPALEAAEAGEVHVAEGGWTNFFTARAAGADILAIGVEDSSNAMGIVASGDSGITTIADLKGKSIAVNRGGSGEYLANRAIDKGGLAKSDVKLEYLTPADAMAAFQAGKVDAIATWEQYFATAQLQPGAVVVATGGELDSLNRNFVWVTRAYQRAHPEVVDELIAFLQDESEKVSDNPQLILNYYKKRGAGDDVLTVVKKFPPMPFKPIDDEVIAKFEQHGADLARYGLIDAVPDIDDAFVKPVE